MNCLSSENESSIEKTVKLETDTCKDVEVNVKNVEFNESSSLVVKCEDTIAELCTQCVIKDEIMQTKVSIVILFLFGLFTSQN